MQNLKELMDKIKGCDGGEPSIERLSRQCLNRGLRGELTVVKMLEDMMNYHPLQIKLIILQIMTQMLINDSSKSYYRHLSSRIYVFFSKFSNNISGEEALVKTLCQIFEKWRNYKVFNEEFYHKILNNCGRLLIESINSHYQTSTFSKYSRKFVESIKEIEKDVHKVSNRSKKEIQQLTARLARLEGKESQRARDQQIQRLRQAVDRLIAQQAASLESIQAAGSNLMDFFGREASSLGITSVVELRQ